MRRFILWLLVLCAIAIWGILLFVWQADSKSADDALPTLFVLPSLTASHTPTATYTATLTPTETATFTPTATHTATVTPTLSERLLEIHAIMPGVYIAPTSTEFPAGTVLLPAPPQPLQPLPNATHESAPFYGWYRFESDHPQVRYASEWHKRQVIEASEGQYHRTDVSGNSVAFDFEGEGLRIAYVVAQNMGIFEVVVDGVVVDRIDAYAENRQFLTSQVYTLDSGTHALIVRSTGEKNSASSGFAVGLDAIDVFLGTANTVILPYQQAIPTEEPRPAEKIELVSAPATLQATETPLAPGELNIAVVIAYDENGNKQVDPAEGVSGISVRIIDADSNRELTQSFTDATGYANLNVVTSAPARVVVPYFGKVWALPVKRNGGASSFTLLLEPGNQPGLIP